MTNETLQQRLQDEGVREILANDLLEFAKRTGKLDEVMTLVHEGWRLGPKTSAIQTAIRQYLCFRTEADFQRARRRLFQQGQNLPPEVVELKDNLEELLKLAQDASLFGDSDFEVFRNKEMLGEIKNQGVAGAKQAILGIFVSRFSGMPLDIAKSQPTLKSMKGLEFLLGIGYENAAKDREFWQDWDRGLPQEQLLEKWSKRRNEADARESARMDRQFRENMEKVQKFWLQQDLDRLRAERLLNERMRKQAEKKRKEARRRTPTPPRKTPPPDKGRLQWMETPIRLLGGGAREFYILRVYNDDSSELFRVQNGRRTVVLERAVWRFAIYQSGAAPLIRPLLAPKPHRDHAARPGGPIGRTPSPR